MLCGNKKKWYLCTVNQRKRISMKKEIEQQKKRRGRPRKQQQAATSATDNQQATDEQQAAEQQATDEQQAADGQEPQGEPMKMRVNIYRALPFIFPKIKVVALSAIMGKDNSWVNNRLANTPHAGRRVYHFYAADLPIVNRGLNLLGEEIMQNLIEYSEDRDEVIRQVKQLASLVNMPYIYRDTMKQPADWYKDRVRPTNPKYNSTFTKLDIMCFNYVARQIAAELMSVEMVL